MSNMYNDSYNPETNENLHDDSIFDPIDSREKKGRKRNFKKTGRKKAARMTAMALSFGLIAGTSFYGTTTVLSGTFGTETSTASEAAASTSSDTTESLLSTSDSGTVSSTGTTSEGTVADVAATALPSLVTISATTVEEMRGMYEYFGNYGNMFGYGGNSDSQSTTYEVSSQGTGVIIGQTEEELLIATNDHVISGATALSVGFVDETAVTAEVKGTDPSTDLAVVSVKITDIPQETLDQIAVAVIGDSDALELGEQVVAIGNALGYGQSVTSGYVSAFNRNLTFTDDDGTTTESTGLIQTDAAINSGNSGGGLFNMNGELIAINEAKSSSSSGTASVDNVGFAIPMSKALPILQTLMEGETVSDSTETVSSSAYLGVNVADVSEQASSMYGLPVGVSIVSITDGSPADEYGLKTGDVITEFNGQTITTYEELKSALASCSAGDTVSMTVSRSTDGEYHALQISIVLGDASTQTSVQ